MTAPLAQRLRAGPRVLLVVEDDPDTAHMLSVCFAGFDYRVEHAERGDEALATTRRIMPNLVLLDIGLPDMDGLEVCEKLHDSPRTSHIPVIILSARSALADRVAGLQAGAQDYVVKPFDLEELRLRVHNLITRSARENLGDPRTSLPTGSRIQDNVRRRQGLPGWHTLEFRIRAFQAFMDLNGFVAGDEALKASARLLREVVDELGGPDDFIGQPANDAFIILTHSADAAALAARLKARFDDELQTHYSFMDREQGFVELRGQDGQTYRAPLMTLEIKIT